MVGTIDSLEFVDEAEVNTKEDETSPVQLGQHLGRHGPLGAVAGKRPQRADIGLCWSALLEGFPLSAVRLVSDRCPRPRAVTNPTSPGPGSPNPKPFPTAHPDSAARAELGLTVVS